jgi:exonuclease SbcD
MRIVHTSDWHLGHQLHGVSREREHAAFLGWLADVCEREAADVVLITGDVFDGSNPPATAQAAYYGFLAEIAARRPDVQVVVIGGNHDSAARLEAPSPLLSRLRVRVVGALPRRADDPAQIDWARAVIQVGGACVLAVPFLRVGDLAAAGAGDDPTAAIRALYAAGVEVARAQANGAPLIVLGHLHVSGAEASALSERRILLGGAEAVTSDLFPADAAYVALGHLHKPQRIGGREQMRYAGSPIPLAMNEAEYRHQVLVVDLGAEVRVRPIEVPRTVELVRVPRRGAAPLEEILPVLAAMEPEDGHHDLRPYLEVHVRLDRPLPQLRGQIEQALEGKRPRLVKITVERAGDGAALGDATPGIALADLAPRDVLLRRWRRDHEGEPPAALIAAFDELVARVQDQT